VQPTLETLSRTRKSADVEIGFMPSALAIYKPLNSNRLSISIRNLRKNFENLKKKIEL
jgi:hypothetical protein